MDEKVLSENKNKIRAIAITGIMLAITVALQAINLPNIITGVIVNSFFVFVFYYVGLKSAITLSFLSPLFGFLTGHVPVLMYPVLPMIALGNILMVVALSKLQNKSVWLKLLLPSSLKALVIGIGGKYMISIFIPDKIQSFLLFSVLGVQFFTALPGIWFGMKLRNDVIKSTNLNNQN